MTAHGTMTGVAAPPPSWNPFQAEPYLHSVNPRICAPPNPLLLSNGWPSLTLAANSKAVIPGVSTNAVGKNYRVLHKIGMGSFGEIYLGVDIRTNERIAIKVENRTTKYPQLMEEFQVYRAVAKGVGVPAAIWCGSNSNVHIMVMELLGDSLETLYNLCNRKFSLKTITMLAIQLLNRIEHHHNHNYLHRDIKPDNFLMGPPQSDKSHILYMVDMGLCKKYRDETTLHHIPYRENKKLIGTPRYASINTHLGIEQCRRDDLESIGYMLVYFFAGKLPWQGLKARNKQEKYDKISQSKMAISVEQLCKGAPSAFQTYLEYCRQLRFTQKPDYKYLRSLFYDIFRVNGWKDDCVYDWMLLKGDGIPAYNIPTAAELAQATTQRATGVALPIPAPAAAPVATPVPAAASATTQQNTMYQMQLAYQQQAQQVQAQAAQMQQVAFQQAQAAMVAAAQQRAAAYNSTPVATPRGSGTPTADPVADLRLRVSGLEKSLAEQRNMTAEWKQLWEKGQTTIQQQARTITQLKAQIAQMQPASAAAASAASAAPAGAASATPALASSPSPAAASSTGAAATPASGAGAQAAVGTVGADVIPLASAASLKRRRTVATTESDGDGATGDDTDPTKRARRKT